MFKKEGYNYLIPLSISKIEAILEISYKASLNSDQPANNIEILKQIASIFQDAYDQHMSSNTKENQCKK